MSDMEDALRFYSFLAGEEPDGTEKLVAAVIPGAPPSKARVRFGKGRTYSSAQMVAAEKRTAVYVAQVLQGYQFEGNVALGCIFYRPTHQRVDADNMLKHVCDAINGLAFKDDSQITSIAARVELDASNPRTVLVLGPHVSTMRRGVNDSRTCARCDKSFSVPGGRRVSQKYCSRECLVAARRVDLSAPIACAYCGDSFKRTTTAQKLCSAECRAASLRDKRRASAAPMSRCASCDKQLNHRRGGQCRDCWRTAPKSAAA